MFPHPVKVGKHLVKHFRENRNKIRTNPVFTSSSQPHGFFCFSTDYADYQHKSQYFNRDPVGIVGGLRGCPVFMGVLMVLTLWMGKHSVILLRQNLYYLTPCLGIRFEFDHDYRIASDGVARGIHPLLSVLLP